MMKRFLTLLALVGMGIHGGAEPPPGAGTLCVGASPCVDAPRMRIAIEPRVDAQPFVWTAARSGEVILGVLAAGADHLDLTGGDRPSLRFSVTSSDDRRWPAPLRVATGGTPNEWRIERTKPVTNVRIVGLPAGDCELRLSADHHRDTTRKVTIGDRPADAGRLTLMRWPVIVGRVVHKDGENGVVGASVLLPSNELLTMVSDPTGDFEAEIRGDWPEAVRVQHGGYGSVVLAVPKIAADADLGLIEMSPAATIHVSLVLPKSRGRVSAELALLVAGVPRPAASQILEGETLTFRDLAPGDYRLLIRGSEPFEQYATDLTVKEGELREEAVHIRPQAMDISVSLRRAPVKGALLEVWNTSTEWSASVTTDDEGHAASPLWQHGEFTAAVNIPPHTSTFAHAAFHSGDVDWDIALPDQRIMGTVVDSRKGKPIAGARVFVNMDEGDTTTLVRRETDEAGSFVVESARPGRHTVTVNAAGFMPGTTTFTTAKGEVDRSVRIAMRRGVERVLRIRTPSGTPIWGALVVDDQGMMGSPVYSDASGAVKVTVPDGERASYYVLPKEGSFAITSVDGDRPGAEEEAVVAPGEASIIVRTLDETSASVPNVSLLMRYNGHSIPWPVTMAMTDYQGRAFSTAAHGKLVFDHVPTGTYDFWPYFSAAEAQSIVQKVTADAPARIAAQPGPNAITLTFARRRKTSAP
jgi:hypothetical protein